MVGCDKRIDETASCGDISFANKILLCSECEKKKNNGMKVYGVVWFTEHGESEPLGIVACNDGFKDKAYLGRGYGVSAEDDVEHIISHGAKFPFELAIQMTGGKE